MSMKTPVQVYLDDEERGLLENLADRLGLSMAETLRVALRRLAADHWDGGDPLLRLAGSLESADVPPDLSTRHDEYAVADYSAPRVGESGPGSPEAED